MAAKPCYRHVFLLAKIQLEMNASFREHKDVAFVENLGEEFAGLDVINLTESEPSNTVKISVALG